MAFLNDAEKERLADKIRQTESRTHAEVVTVIAQQSDGYRYIPMLWAALLALSVPGLHYLWNSIAGSAWTVQDSDLASATWTWLYPAQVLTFLGLGVLFQLPQARLWMIPRSVKQQRAARHAREQFFLQKLHLTRERTGVLIFVSVAEHYVEIIVDTGVAEVIDNQRWEAIVQGFIAQVQRGDIAAGFDGALDQCQTLLWEHFPAPEGNPDELPNHLIEV
ncbi:TPM domain-containing protein [Granulosicoccus sp. 3-233]|uniref:TPM domain-containing protein n=1 Tax=Granulosicoccus sp. 3-233 TaxID=3417969 RepID=UPI003D32DFF2